MTKQACHLVVRCFWNCTCVNFSDKEFADLCVSVYSVACNYKLFWLVMQKNTRTRAKKSFQYSSMVIKNKCITVKWVRFWLTICVWIDGLWWTNPWIFDRLLCLYPKKFQPFNMYTPFTWKLCCITSLCFRVRDSMHCLDIVFVPSIIPRSIFINFLSTKGYTVST